MIFDQKIIDYITTYLEKGKNKKSIYSDLINKGLKVDEIQRYFDEIVAQQKKEKSDH